MDNMKDKFAQFSGISIMLVSASMTLFTRLVDGYYELKNVLSIILKFNFNYNVCHLWNCFSNNDFITIY